MAQNQNKRRRKRRGTQGGSIDSRRAARPRSREEARARARQGGSSSSRTKTKADLPPTWKNSIIRGFGAAIIFALLLILIFQRPVGPSAIFGVAMLAFYVPAGYYVDLALWRKRERQRIRARNEGR